MNKITLVMILLIFKGQCFASAHDNRQSTRELPTSYCNTFRNQLRKAETQRLGKEVVEDSVFLPSDYCSCHKKYLEKLEDNLLYARIERDGIKLDRNILLGTTLFLGATTLLFASLWRNQKK